MGRRLVREQSVRLTESPDVIGSVKDSMTGWVLVVRRHPRDIRGTSQWYDDGLVEALGNGELQWEEYGDG